MKAIGIVGSPRKEGNTEIITNHALKAITEESIETELIRLAGLDIRPCQACLSCRNTGKCIIDDDLYPIYLKMKEADAIILSSPVYISSVTSLMKALIERSTYMEVPQRVFAGKVGGPLVVAARGGLNFTVAELNFWFQYNGLYTPGGNSWHIAFGREKGEVLNDELGMQTAWTFGKNVAFLLKKINA